MSTDYSKMSDTEIAQKVFFWLSSDFFPNSGLAHINKDGFFFFDNRHLKRKFDPCNNPSDAWPIIVENRIRINPILYTKWMAEDYLEDVSSCHENPLRAAMIVFLMMQESRNAS